MPITDLNLAKLATSSDGLEYALTFLRREQQAPLYRLRIRGGRVGHQPPVNEAASVSLDELRTSVTALCAALELGVPMGQQTPNRSTLDLSTIDLGALADQRDRDVAGLEAALEEKRAAFETDVAALKASIAAKRIEARECRRAADRLARLTRGGGANGRRATRSTAPRAAGAPGLEEQIRACLAEAKGVVTVTDLAEQLARDQATINRCVGRMAGRGLLVRDDEAVRLTARGKKGAGR